MKKLLLVTLMLITQATFAQAPYFRFNDIEFFTASTSIDPTSSIKENGLDVVGELEYAGLIYAKVGFESFSVLYQGYKDFHYGIGLNFTSGYFNKLRYYVGFRQARVVRDNTWRINQGLEAGIDYNLNEHLFIGLRSTLDKRNDQEIQDSNLKPEIKLSGFIRLGYKWYYKK